MLSREWFSLSELAAEALPGMPDSRSGIASYAAEKGWNEAAREGQQWRKRPGRGGGVEYHFSLLPLAAKVTITARYSTQEGAAERAAREQMASEALWHWYARQTNTKKQEAERRLGVIRAVEEAVRGGMRKVLAVQMVGRETGVSQNTFYNWEARLAGVNRSDWLPALAPRHAGAGAAKAECSPEAWEALKVDWLRPAQPTFTSCYRRVQKLARKEGWSVPSERTLYRRMLTTVPETTRVAKREGEEALDRLYPAQRRDRSGFHALEAINMDAHTCDVFVEWPDGTRARPVMEAVQDLYSGKLLAWRIDRSENTQVIRLAIGDVIEQYGIPKHFWFDNTRASANKQITGGAKQRFRFKVKEEDPDGLVVQLGGEVHWTKTYRGQAKPIERSFREAARDWAKDPRFNGAYTGPNPAAKPSDYATHAVPLAYFLQVWSDLIDADNAREDRTSANCRGRSFDQAFNESYAAAAEKGLIQKANQAQRNLWLLAAEARMIQAKQPLIELADNRYFADFMLQHRGQKVVVRFDADDLHAGIHVYGLDNRYLGHAPCVEDVGFADTAAAREWSRVKGAWLKAKKRMAKLEGGMPLKQYAEMLDGMQRSEPAPAPETKVVRPVFGTAGNAALKPDFSPRQDTAADEDAIINALDKFHARRAAPRLVEPEED
jgi:transposase InsO family protein